MKKAAVRTGTALALLALTTVLLAQQPVPTPATGQPGVGTQPLKGVQQTPYRAKQILGSKVSIKDNISIGTVDDIVFDDSGAIEYLVVNNENKMVTVPWEAAKFSFDKTTSSVVLPITQEQ